MKEQSFLDMNAADVPRTYIAKASMKGNDAQGTKVTLVDVKGQGVLKEFIYRRLVNSGTDYYAIEVDGIRLFSSNSASDANWNGRLSVAHSGGLLGVCTSTDTQEIAQVSPIEITFKESLSIILTKQKAGTYSEPNGYTALYTLYE